MNTSLKKPVQVLQFTNLVSQRLRKMDIITPQKPLIYKNDLSQWKFWPIGTGSELYLQVSLKTTEHPGARLVFHYAKASLKKPVIPRVYLCVNEKGMWELIGETKEEKFVCPLVHSHSSTIDVFIVWQKGKFYFFSKKSSEYNEKEIVLENILPKITFKGKLHMSLLLPPMSDSNMTISSLIIRGKDITIDRRIV